MRKLIYFLILLVMGKPALFAQVSYSASKVYSLRKVVPTYTGSAITMRRACDNATANVGFTSCGDLDTTTLKAIALAAPLSALTATSPAAFSLRKLRCSYSGNCINVRSTSGTTANIGFTTNGDLDTVALKAAVTGTNSGFVTIWYDQSGNGRDASQATTTDQPRIVNAGVIEYQNNRPALRFQDASDGLQTAGYTAYTASMCMNGVAKVNANLGSYNTFATKTGSGGSNNYPAPFDFYFAVATPAMWHIVGDNGSATFFSCSQNFDAAQPLGIWTFCSQLSTNTASLNGSSILSAGAAATFSDRGQPLNIGKRNDGVTGLNGWIQEIVTFATIPSATDIKYLEYTQSVYYSISGPTISTFPTASPDMFVTTWFDQSGNAANASQATASLQPQIMDNGVITYNAGRPAITFNGTSQSFTAAASTTAFDNSTGGFLSVVGRSNATANWKTFAQQGRNSSPWWGIWGDNASPAKWVGGFSNGPGNMISTINASVYAVTDLMQTPSTSTQLYVNGTLLNSATTANSSNNQVFTIGLSNTNEYLSGSIAEIQVFAQNMRNTRRKLIESNQAANYSVTVSGTVYTPPTATTYNRFVVGVGRENGATGDSVAGTRSTVGMGFKVGTTASDFLKDNGDYITAGISCPISAGSSTANCPGTIQARWSNDWYVNKTDVSANSGNLQFYFDFGDKGVTQSPGSPSNYELLYRSTSSGNFTIVPGTTKSVSGDQVLFLVSAANITTNYWYTIGTSNILASPLPIELLSFEALKQNNGVKLKWTTASEKNTSHYVVQRLVAGTDFEEVGKPVEAAGNSTTRKEYSRIDTDPKKGINYYRLKQVDFDGTFSYSKTEFVEFDGELNPSVFPNPGTGVFTVSNCKDYTRLTILTTLGAQIYSQDIHDEQITFDLLSFENGLYFLVLFNENSGKQTTLKLMKK